MAKGKRSHKPRDAVFHPEFIDDLKYWIQVDRRTARRALEVVSAVLNDPFSGIGKPEPLKYLAPNTWSRRLTQEHRIVYMVKEERVEFLQARYHYE
jgi:toxin YoeB